ncbi:hypothetical protein HDU87_001141 [Geranomyces variabilis]|uniref:PUL domain-containing protein n=1 Tax=Geranomyces variabilis TaxID=109894 RepID=A0AAD5XSW6_9FUNG|nr:hypothetical protein HDU87_001141 [Geranomyces variabilis]
MGNQPSGMAVGPDGRPVLRYLVREGDVHLDLDGQPVYPIRADANGPAPTFRNEETQPDGRRILHFNMPSTLDTAAALRAYQLEMRQNGNNLFPMHHAAQHGQVDAIARLLDGGANINQDGNSREKPVHTAVQFGQLSVVQLLLARGADPCAAADWVFPASPRKMTPLHYAVLFHSGTRAGVHLSLRMAIALLDAGANPHSPPGAFRFACKEGRMDVADCILDRTDFPAPYPPDDRGALMFSLYSAYAFTGIDRAAVTSVVNKVLALDSTLVLTVNDYEPADEMKGPYTPYVENPHLILMRANTAGMQRQTPLLALMIGQAPITPAIRHLLDLGADPNLMVMDTNATALHMLATPPPGDVPDVEAVRLLVERGADTSARDILGRTAADVAVHPAIKALLRSHVALKMPASSAPAETKQGLSSLLVALKRSGTGTGATLRIEVGDDGLTALDWCLRNITTESVFPALDVLRLVVLDVGIRNRWAAHPTLSSFIYLIKKYDGDQDSATPLPKAVRLMTLRLACNLFSTPSGGAYMLHPHSNRGVTTALLINALLMEDVAVRKEAASLAFNIVTFDARVGADGARDQGHEDWACELVAAAGAALQNEEAEEIVLRLVATLAYLIRGASDAVLGLAAAVELAETVGTKASGATAGLASTKTTLVRLGNELVVLLNQ